MRLRSTRGIQQAQKGLHGRQDAAPAPKPQTLDEAIDAGRRAWENAITCHHERLNEDGICRRCGADCRGRSI